MDCDVIRLDDARRTAFAALRSAAERLDRGAFGEAVGALLSVGNPTAAEAIADVQWIVIGGLVRGDAIQADRVRSIVSAATAMKAKLMRERFSMPPFMPFLMRTMVAANALLAALAAPASGPAGRLDTAPTM